MFHEDPLQSLSLASAPGCLLPVTPCCAGADVQVLQAALPLLQVN